MVNVDTSRRGKRRVEFTCSADAESSVFVAGSFNDWDPNFSEMKYDRERKVFACEVKLAPGTYEYKFVVNGVWGLDCENDNVSANDFGTLNSVVEVI
ncbi:MAG: glycogen-binding domain-containing protein [Lentisphaeria bacterium]|nr:glycogen-binding domain-containing protein [Lentisphaeria bacterium]MBR7119448.1 glycogen-binding domain-containing protein [Lentisphaeria bacterium]